MVPGHKIKKKIEISKFLEMIQEYEEKDLETTNHTFFRLNETQREVYTEEKIKEIFFNEEPFLVGIQNNDLWALFYKYEKKIFRVLVDLQPCSILIFLHGDSILYFLALILFY